MEFEIEFEPEDNRDIAIANLIEVVDEMVDMKWMRVDQATAILTVLYQMQYDGEIH